MRVLCRHGFFSFYPEDESDLARFCSRFGIDLVKMHDFYTFPLLSKVPGFSIKGAQFLNLVSTKTFEGEPWEVMRENKVVYSIQNEMLVHVSSITESIAINQTTYNFIVESALIQPGSKDGLGKSILSYDANFELSFNRLVLRGVWSE